MKDWLWLWCLVLLLTACQGTTPIPTEYQGPPLPAPPALGLAQQPPAAWFVVQDQAVVATYGSFKITTGGHGDAATYADAPLAEIMPGELAKVEVMPNVQAQIIVGSEDTAQFQTITQTIITIRPWQGKISIAELAQRELRQRTINSDVKREGTLRILNLPPLADSDNHVLQLEVFFSSGSTATYVWRINPATT